MRRCKVESGGVGRIACTGLGCGKVVAFGAFVRRKRIERRGGRGWRRRRGCCGGGGGAGGNGGVVGVVIGWRHARTRRGELVGFWQFVGGEATAMIGASLCFEPKSGR